jgi:hypothetical protein
MDEQNLWSMELVKQLPNFPNAIKNQIYITCKAQNGLGKSQKNYTWVCLGLVLKNRAIFGW